MGLFGDAHGWVGQKAPLPKSVRISLGSVLMNGEN